MKINTAILGFIVAEQYNDQQGGRQEQKLFISIAAGSVEVI